jgi:hypothetical protein
MTSEADLVHLPLLPLERGGDLVVCGGEPLDRVAHLVLPATLFGDDPAGLGGDVTAAFGGDAAA